MRAQFSLRTLIVVMTLGGPLLAEGARVAPTIAAWLSPCKKISWQQALAEAQKVQPIGGGFQSVSKTDIDRRDGTQASFD